jgi:hypothetical protein
MRLSALFNEFFTYKKKIVALGVLMVVANVFVCNAGRIVL